jgi:hypothetical protein
VTTIEEQALYFMITQSIMSAFFALMFYVLYTKLTEMEAYLQHEEK